MKAVVAILNWNGQKLLQQFLPGVIQTAAHRAEIAVIDNASTDNSVEWIQTNHPEITVIRNSSNEGFAKGYNSGLTQLSADIFILLNSDIEVTAGWIEPLLDMFQNGDVAAAQPKIRSWHQRDSFEYAGAAGGFIDRDGFIFCRGRMFDTYEQDLGQYDYDREIFWATGACLAIRADAFVRAGGLDEDFFAHMEEIDLCWRLKNAGMKIWYCHRSMVYHQGGGTLNKINPQKTYLNFRNNLFLILKNYRLRNVFIKLLWRMVMDGLAGIRFLIQGQWAHCLAVIRAHFSFYASFGRFYKKRQQLAVTIQGANYTGFYRKSVVWKYFIEKRKRFSDLDPTDFY